MKKYKKVLSIAGSDSGGGAGIQADIKAISACGCYAMTAITAVTVQNTVGVRGFHVVPAEVVAGQIAAVLEDIGADAVKLGMLPTDEMIVPIAESLKKYRVRSVVMDPVMVATSGDRLISEAAAQAIRRHIFPLATLVTPNVPEAEYITGMPIRSEADFPAAAAALRDMGAGAVLLKAGHLDGAELTEYLSTATVAIPSVTREPTRRIRTAPDARCRRPSPLSWRRTIRSKRRCCVRKTMSTRRLSAAGSIGSETDTGPYTIFIVFGSRFPEE